MGDASDALSTVSTGARKGESPLGVLPVKLSELSYGRTIDLVTEVPSVGRVTLAVSFRAFCS